MSTINLGTSNTHHYPPARAMMHSFYDVVQPRAPVKPNHLSTQNTPGSLPWVFHWIYNRGNVWKDRLLAHSLSRDPNASANGKTSGFATRPLSRADVPTVISERLTVSCIIEYLYDTRQAVALADNGSGEGFLRATSSLRPKRKTRPFAATVFISKVCRKGSGWRGAPLKALALCLNPSPRKRKEDWVFVGRLAPFAK